MGQKITIKKFWRKNNTTRALPEDDEKVKKWKDIAERAAKTFLESFLASLPVDAALIAGGWDVWRAALTAAVASGISAVINFALYLLRNKGGDPE